ncbi:MAG: hypothetical protein GVY13_06940 [Alphaproteobacteria bacterium]|jgi:hypothetical protein|nr:hypothetical protein [Alphaproteobacteria bacterium]
MSTEWTEAEIAAWVDGQLDGTDAERIARLVVADPEAGAYAEAVRKTNQALMAAYEDPLAEPVPAAIRRAIESHPAGAAVPAARGFGRRAHRPSRRPAALAASVALVFGLAAGLGIGGLLWGPGTDTRVVAAPGTAQPGGPLFTALETLASGSITDSGVRPMLTFRDAAGRYCREFEVVEALPQETELGIACRTPSGDWHVEILVAAPQQTPSGANGFVPAGGPAGDALGSMLDAMGAGQPLAPQEESRLLEEGWSP